MLKFILPLILIFIIPVQAQAAFSLSATPYEGGFDLRFGKVDPAFRRVNKEVILRINSDINKQYRIIQNILDPLTTSEGNTIASNSLVVYAIRGTNQYGTLNVIQEVPLSLGRQVIYTSNQQGVSDSFTLVYGLNLPQDVAPGSYRGRIAFSLETIDSSSSPVIIILNILAEVSVESTIKIKTITGSKSITLKAEQKDPQEGTIVFDIQGGFGKQFKILQIVSEQPVSNEGNMIDWDVVKFIGQDASKGMVINQETGLSNRQQILYTSSLRGEPDTFSINYYPVNLNSQPAGLYRTKLRFVLEGVGFAKTQLLDLFSLEVDNPKVFDLIVTPELGGTIRFRDLKPLQPPKTQEVIFEVKSNIGKPYQVTQMMPSLLVSKDGVKLPVENFTIREESLETKGTLNYLAKTPVQDGQSVLFISDKLGSPAKFKVIYEISLPRDVSSGDYNTNFSFSVNEI